MYETRNKSLYCHMTRVHSNVGKGRKAIENFVKPEVTSPL